MLTRIEYKGWNGSKVKPQIKKAELRRMLPQIPVSLMTELTPGKSNR